MQSSRLPPEAGAGAAAELILKALKLAFAHEQQPASRLGSSHSGPRPLQAQVSMAEEAVFHLGWVKSPVRFNVQNQTRWFTAEYTVQTCCSRIDM